VTEGMLEGVGDGGGIRPLIVLAGEERGGSLLLLRPQPPVARMLELTGAEHAITVRGASTATP
jgi:hypothetical protein